MQVKNPFTTFLLLLFFCCVTTFGQAKNPASISKNDTSFLKKETNSSKQIEMDDNRVVVISIQQFDELTKLLKKEGGDGEWKYILPSISALLVVIISTFGAIYIGKRQINSNNSKDWVIDIRNTISELITQANLLNIEFQETTVNSDKRKAIHEKFVYNKNKLYLLLKPENKKHKILIDSLGELLTILDTHLLNSKANNNPSLNIGFIPYDNGRFMAQTTKVVDNARDLLTKESKKI